VRTTPLLLILLAALLLMSGLWLLASGGGSSLLPEVLASEPEGAPDALSPTGGDDETAASEEGGGRESIDTPPPPPTPEELAALENAPDSQVWGRVLGMGGAPLEGVEVIARSASRWMALPADLEKIDVWGRGDESWTAITDAEGRFHFDDFEPDDYGFAVRADGYAPHGRLCEKIPEHEQYQLGDFQLTQGIVVDGTVVDHRGQPIEGVRVLRAVSSKGGSSRLELEGMGVPLGTTDAAGAFRAGILAPGSWHLIFESDHHRVTELTGVTEPAGRSEHGVRVIMESGLTIEGRIDGLSPTAERPLRVQARRSDEQPTGDAAGGEPAERERSRHAVVATDATFRIEGLIPNTRYRLELQRQVKDDAEPLPAPHDPWREMPGAESMRSMSGEKDVVLRYREESSLVLKVVDAQTGDPVTTYVARLWGSGLGGAGLLEDESGETDKSHPGGVATFDHLRPRRDGSDSTLFVRAEGYRDLRREGLMLKPGEAKDLGELQLEPAPTVTVRVVDDATGDPIPAARVFLAGPEAEDSLEGLLQTDHDHMPEADRDLFCVRTGDNGRARITAIPGKLCRLRAVGKGFAPCESVTSAPPHDVELELRLTRCGTVTVLVTNEKGEPASGVQIRRQQEGGESSHHNYWDSGAQARDSTDEAGKLVFDDLRPGRWTFWIVDAREAEMGWFRGPDQSPTDGKVDQRVESGESYEVELEVKAQGGAQVRVTQGGEACVSALIQLKKIMPDGEGEQNWWWSGGIDDPLRQVTDHEGRATFSGLELGNYRATVSHPDRRMPRGFELVVEEVVEREQHFELGITAIEGIVVNTAGEPLSNLQISIAVGEGEHLWSNDYRVKVSLDEDGDADFEWEPVEQGSLRTDRDGRYRLDGVRPELPLVVSVRGSYIVPESRRVDPLMRDEVRTGIDFQLEPAGVLEVKLTGLSGRGRQRSPLRLTRRVAEGEESESVNSSFRRSGSRHFSSLRPGVWTIELLDPSGENVIATTEAEVVVGEMRRAQLSL
jgi:hypothetical protein